MASCLLAVGVAAVAASRPDPQLAVEAPTATADPGATRPAATPTPAPDVSWPRPWPGLWRRLPPSPLAPRTGHVLITTGRQLLVWGGSDPRGRPLTDGAVFDLGTGRWRRLPAISARGSGVDGVWTGEDVVVVSPTETWRWDPDAVAWRTVARVPRPRGLDPAGQLRAAGAVVVTLLTADDGSGRSAVFALDPGAARWRRLPDPPSAVGRDDVLLADAERLMLAAPGRSGRDPAIAELALDDAVSGWRTVPQPPGFTADRVGRLSGVLDRSRVLLWGSGSGPDGGGPATWAAVRENGAWRRVDPGPVRPSPLVEVLATGDGALVWDRVDERGALRRWGTDRWTRIFPAPLEERASRPVGWTGSGVVIWGGDDADGGVFTPR